MMTEAVVVLAIMSAIGIGLGEKNWFTDKKPCEAGGKPFDFNIGSPDDPLKVSFKCEGSGRTSNIAQCTLNDVTVKAHKSKVVTLQPSGNKYDLDCFKYSKPVISELLASRICKNTDKPKETIVVDQSADKVEVSFECNWHTSKFTKCFPPGMTGGVIASSDPKSVGFGGKSGRKYLIECHDEKSPIISEDYSAERCHLQTKFMDSIPASGSPGSIDVEFLCGSDGRIAGCRPNLGDVVDAWQKGQFTKGDAKFNINCYPATQPTITVDK